MKRTYNHNLFSKPFEMLLRPHILVYKHYAYLHHTRDIPDELMRLTHHLWNEFQFYEEWDIYVSILLSISVNTSTFSYILSPSNE